MCSLQATGDQGAQKGSRESWAAQSCWRAAGEAVHPPPPCYNPDRVTLGVFNYADICKGTNGQGPISQSRGSCQAALRQSSDGDVISLRGSKGRNFRSIVDTTQPPSGSAGLWGGPDPTTCSQILCWGGEAEEAGLGSRLLSHGHRDPTTCFPTTFQHASGSATSAQAWLHLDPQHLATCAHIQLRPHELLSAVLLFWEPHFE